MELKLINHDRYWPSEQALLNYFGREKRGEAVSELFEGSEFYTVKTSIKLGEEVSVAYSRAKKNNKNALDHCIRRSFFKAALPLLEKKPPWGALTGIRPAKPVIALLNENKAPYPVLTDFYRLDRERAELAVSCAMAAIEAGRELAREDISFYVGIPFCPSKCAYCSFISGTYEKSGKLIDPYIDALCLEIEETGKILSRLGVNIVSLYIGGGTPTVLNEAQTEKLLGTIGGHLNLTGLREYTVEAGRPDTITPSKLSILRRYGVNRISVNPQTLDDTILRRVGRKHTALEAVEALKEVKTFGFECVNADLIAGLPGDTPDGFMRSLEGVAALCPEQVTVHTLCLKRGSELFHDEDPFGENIGLMLSRGGEYLKKYGYEPYYIYRQKFSSGGYENTGWKKSTLEPRFGLYNICMMEELCTVVSVGAGGVTKLINRRTGLIERVFHQKYPLEYLRNYDKINKNLNALETLFNES